MTFVNDAPDLHVTVFHTSHPDDIRPNALVEGGGKQPTPIAPRVEYLEKELALIAAQTCTTPQLTLELDRVVMADSGVLLGLWVERTGLLDDLRSRYVQYCMYAPERGLSVWWGFTAAPTCCLKN